MNNTVSLIRGIEKNATVIWRGNTTHHAKRAAKTLGRTDLTFISFRKFIKSKGK